MERIPGSPAGASLRIVLLVALSLSCSGCVGFVSAMLYKGRMAPAACDKLKQRKVAIVCVGDSGDFGPNQNASLLAKRVGGLLKENVPGITLISHQKIDAWMDEHDVDYVDYQAIGKGVGAEMLVVIDLESLRLQDNNSLYKGTAKYRLRVLDITDGGHEVYAPFTPETVYPRIESLHSSSVPREQFRHKFIDVLASDIAVHFYEHDLNQQIAIDTIDLPTYR